LIEVELGDQILKNMSTLSNVTCSEAEVLTVGTSDAVKSRSGKRRRQKRRGEPLRIQVLLNPVVAAVILERLRDFPRVGPADLLRLRLVCRVWAFQAVPFLDEAVWTRWVNPLRRWTPELSLSLRLPSPTDRGFHSNRQLVQRKLRMKTQESICPRVKLLRGRISVEPLPDCVSVVSIEASLPTIHRKMYDGSCKRCHGRGQGNRPFCFHCPRSVHQRQMKNRFPHLHKR